jgi:type I restriction enzyme S subunit
LAKIARPSFDGVCSTDILPVRPTPRLDAEYLAYFLRQPDSVALASERASGANLPRLSPSELLRVRLPLPSIDEQRWIARILAAADKLRAQRYTLVKRLDALVTSIFHETFQTNSAVNFQAVPLSDAFWFQEGPGIRKWQFTDEGVKVLNVGNIQKSGTLDLATTTRHVSASEAFGKYKHFLVDEGDLVVASSGISFDGDGLLRTRGAFVSEHQLPLCMNTSTIRFKALPGISDLRYLRTWIDTEEFRRQITRRVTGSAQQNFGPTHLATLSITLPPFDRQRQFASRVAAIEAVGARNRLACDAAASLFASLQQRAFAGEL